MSINSDYKDGGFTGFQRSELKLALAFGQSNIGEGFNTVFSDLTMTDAATELLYAVSALGGPTTATWDDIRGASGGYFGAMVQFLLSRWDKGEVNWAGLAYSRGGYALEDDWLPGTDLETIHLRQIMDRYGELLGYANGHNNPIHLDTLYYYQGESDMVSTAFADEWKKNWYELIARFNAYGLTWDRLVLVKPSSQGYGATAGYTTITDMIDEITAERSDTVMLDASEVQVDGAGSETSTGHLNTIGQMQMGQAWSAAYDTFQ